MPQTGSFTVAAPDASWLWLHAVRRVRMIGLVMKVVPARPCFRAHGSPLQVVLLSAWIGVSLTGQVPFLQGTMVS